MKRFDFLIAGAGIFGISTAISLRQKGYSVCVLNPDVIPSPLAASTDISKIVRMEYGADEEYMDMARGAIETWRGWNELFGEPLYHETGFLLLTRQSLESGKQTFEASSYQNLLKRGLEPRRMDSREFSDHYPRLAPGIYQDGFFHAVGGYAEAGKVVLQLAQYARQLGVEVKEGQGVKELIIDRGAAKGVITVKDEHYSVGHVIVCAGNFTPYLLPELQPYMQVTGHPVFHLRPSRPDLFTWENFPVFAADISNTGWYGFPTHPREGVVKIARHSSGLILDPRKDKRIIQKEQESACRSFLQESFPSLANAPFVYRRLCCYTDTLDGHFWIDRHPELKGLSVGSGGSGHGFKMGPVIGDMIAAVAEGEQHQWSGRYRWRHLEADTQVEEEARYMD